MAQRRLHPNLKLLIASGRLACADGDPATLGPLLPSGEGEWAALLSRASDEGMMGILYDQLDRAGLLHGLPQAAQQRLQRAFRYHALDYQLKRSALEELAALEPTGIQLLLLQGMAILDRIYPSPGMRPLSDIDLLIRRDDLMLMGERLVALGYAAISRYPPVYVRDDIRVDLHSELAYLSRVEPRDAPLRVDDGPLWAAAIPWKEGTRLRTLSPADQIILLSAHLQKHSFGRLIWFVDIGRLLRIYLSNGLSDGAWRSLAERAARLRLEKPLHAVGAYLRTVFELPLPDTAAPVPSLGRMERALLARLLDNRRFDGMGDLLYLLSIDGPLTRLRFLTQLALPQQPVIRESVGSSSLWKLAAGYLGRVGRLSGQAVRLFGRLPFR
jgi:hypothetical protein